MAAQRHTKKELLPRQLLIGHFVCRNPFSFENDATQHRVNRYRHYVSLAKRESGNVVGVESRICVVPAIAVIGDHITSMSNCPSVKVIVILLGKTKISNPY